MAGNGFDLGSLHRRRSSHGTGSGSECREVADGLPRAVPVRDAKVPHGPVLAVGAGACSSFAGAIRSGELGR
ncbi:DUF397 domain-containing protein [Streptomyces sp. NPDC019645]|uniref:DUF397 domain-containing protein n=1 Tax=Streptomyces sp. NPDC019645 TaxID=3154786 RepID=UPI0033E54617